MEKLLSVVFPNATGFVKSVLVKVRAAMLRNVVLRIVLFLEVLNGVVGSLDEDRRDTLFVEHAINATLPSHLLSLIIAQLLDACLRELAPIILSYLRWTQAMWLEPLAKLPR